MFEDGDLAVQIGYVDQKVCICSLDHFRRILFEYCLFSVKNYIQNCNLVPVFKQKNVY